jgi:hypothetical protein
MAYLTKTLETLIERAERKGTAAKRVREGSIMGNQLWGMSVEEQREYVKSTPMVEQWRVTVQRTKQDGEAYKNIIVDHYGTEIAFIIVNETRGTTDLHNYYGESNSDRDALNGLCSHYGIDRGFSYRPSTGEFIEVTAEREDIGKIQADMIALRQEHIRKEATWILS